MKNKLSFIFLIFLFLLPLYSNAQEEELAYPAGTLLALDGVENSAVYLVGSDNKKYVFPDSKTYFTWYQNFDDVIKVNTQDLDFYQDGGVMPYRAGSRLVTHQNTAKIYAVEPKGVLRWIADTQTAENLFGMDWSKQIQDIIPGYFSSSYIKGEDLSDTLPTGTLVQEGNTSNYYYIENGQKRKFLDTSTFIKNNFDFDFVYSRYDLDNYPNGDDILDKEDKLSVYYLGTVEDNLPLISQPKLKDQKIIFLTHALGRDIYEQGQVDGWFENYNKNNQTVLSIVERDFPDVPYAWSNYPYDFWNLWVNGACDSTEEGIECLNTLTEKYNVIIFNHSYEASNVLLDANSPSAASERKSIENYKAQYRALRDEMARYPENLFIVWTLPPRHPLYSPGSGTRDQNAQRATDFSNWLRQNWLTEDAKDHSNIKVFDFRSYTMDENNFLKYDYLISHNSPNSQINQTGNQYLGPIFSQFILDSMKEVF
ncbi:hypothetical protein KKH39_01895 [Patescibacteria group bacterium]|nr:hypothetical protein [Patescibacteria group bacterium]